jgi:hypothetical protein
MLSLLASLMVFAASPPVADRPGTAVVFATVGESEWCPAGNVRVDLRTGDYAFTATAPRTVCQDETLERRVSEGRLYGAQLRVLRQDFQRTVSDGLNLCRNGRAPEETIFSNGGLHVLVVTDGRRTDAAPTDLSCWTPAAWSLHDRLAETFPRPTR